MTKHTNFEKQLYFAVFSMLLMILALLVTPALAQDDVTLTVTGAVNVRSGPGTEYTLHGTLISETVTVTGRNEWADPDCRQFVGFGFQRWVRIDFDGIEGWVAYCIGTVEGDAEALEIVEPSNAVLRAERTPRTPTEPRLGTAPEGDSRIAFLHNHATNIREEANLDSDIVDVIVINRSVPVYVIDESEDGAWLEIQYSAANLTGWVARANVLESFAYRNR